MVLSYLLKDFSGIIHTGASLCFAVPSDITQVEKRAFFQVLRTKVSAGKIRLVDKGIADAVSAELAVLSSRGHMIVNIGADTTEISVIASGKVILSQTLKVGGRKLDEDIATMVRRKFNLNIGQKTAEALKNNLAFMINGPKLEQKVFGIHTLSGLPKSDLIPSLAVSVAIIDTIDSIIESIKSVYNRVPPQLMKDITREGIYLSGGVSMIQNLPEYIRKEIGIPIHHIQDPKNSTIRGLVEILNNKDLRQTTYSLNDLTGMR
jgi:rod shape-determining protein MreB